MNVEAKIFQFGTATFKFPALMQIDEEGGLQKVTIAEPSSGRSLAAEALALPGDQTLLWLDACDTLAPLTSAAAEGAFCLLSGALGAEDLNVVAMPASTFVPRDALRITAAAGPSAVLADRQDGLRNRLVEQGFAPKNVALGIAGYQGRDLIVRSLPAGQGASLVRLMTTDSLDAGMDVELARGINLVAIGKDGAPTLLANVDSCQPKDTPAPFKTAIEAAVGAVAFAIVTQDSAVCDAGPGALLSALAGLDLPDSLSVGFRQPYATLVIPGVAPREFL